MQFLTISSRQAVDRRRHTGLRAGLFAIVAIGAPFMADLSFGQQAAAGQDTAAPQAESLGEVVVTARRQTERERDVPITIVALNADQLRVAGVTDMRDLGTAVPGLAISGTGAFFEPSLRGVSGSLTEPGGNSPIATYVDGVYQPNLAGEFFDLPDVANVEVLKGPQGTLFGRNATAGAITITTADPSFTPSGTVSVADGIYFGGTARTSNDVTTKLKVTGPLFGDVLAGSFAGFYQKVPGYLTNDQTGTETGNIESYSFRAKLMYVPSDYLKFVLTGYNAVLFDDANAAVAAYRGVTVGKFYPGAIVPDLPYHVASELRDGVSSVDTHQSGGSLRAEWRIPGAGTITSLSSFTKVFSFYLAEVDGTYSPACVAVFSCITPYLVDYGPNNTIQQELTFSSEKFGPTKFVAGLFFYRDSAAYGSAVNPPLNSAGNLTGAPAPYYNASNVTTHAAAAFGEANTDITESLHLTTGLRFSWERQKGEGNVLGGPIFGFGNEPLWTSWTPRVSLRYDINQKLNVYATYSQGFKSGVLDAISLTQDVAQPEKLYSYEIGAKYGSENVILNASVFYYDYKNFQVQFQLPDAASVIGNAPKATLYGLDLDGTFRLPYGYQVRAAGSWLPRATYDTLDNAIDYETPINPVTGLRQVSLDVSGQRMLRAPRFTGNVTLNYTHPLAAGTFDANGVLYQSTSYAYDYLNNIQSSFYVTLGGSIGFRPTDSGFHYRLWVKNATNRERIQAETTSAEANTVVYSPPREVGITLDYAF